MLIKLSKLLLVLSFATAALGDDEIKGNHEIEFLELQATGQYSTALNMLHTWSKNVNDPVLLEINMFRIYELAFYPEQYQQALEIYENLQKHETVKNDPLLLQRLGFFQLKLLFRMDRLREVTELKKKLNFLDFHILGPFRSGTIADFDIERSLPDINSKTELPGKNYPVSWFSSNSDREGRTDVNALLPESDTANSLFYYGSKLELEQGGMYRFFVSKTGICEISIDGTVIFRNTDQHDITHGQYIIEANIPAGDHTIIVKLDSSDSGNALICSMQFVSASNENNSVSAISSSRFRAFEESSRGDDDASLFRVGYLFDRSCLAQDGVNETLQTCSGIAEDSPYYPYAQYYSAIASYDDELQAIYFQKAIMAYPKYTEAIFSLAILNIRNGFYYKAWPLLEDLKANDRTHLMYEQALCSFNLALNRGHEVLKISNIFSKVGYNSLYFHFASLAHINNREYSKAETMLSKLYLMDHTDSDVFGNILDVFQQTGNITELISTLEKTIARRPNNIYILLKLSDLVEKEQGPENAIPFLSAALKRSPQNSQILYKLGMIYNKTNRTDLAVQYISESLKRDPANHGLKQYLDFLLERNKLFAEQQWDGDIKELETLADATKDQKAVWLLNEQLFHINRDASYEKYIHKIVKIYDESAINDFRNQYIIYEPGIDSIENIRCRVINDGEVADITERYTRELSDPESRLYYNLEAVMIPVSSLRRGSILDISYTIKNRGAVEYRNAFSETLLIGSPYSTVLFRAALSHPDNTSISVFTKDIDQSAVKKETRNNITYYKTELKNIKPYKNEIVMPPTADILPAIYFTSHKSWNELASWYRSLLKNRIIMSDEMQKALASIINKNDSEREKVSKIYNHVTDSIRYVGFELGVGAFQPRTSDKTYSSRMGDCKDIAIVLTAFLRAANIDASIALINTRDKGQVNLNAPTIGAFNHAICFVNIDGGLFLDGTLDNTSYLELPGSIKDVNALVIDEKTHHFIKTTNSLYSENVDKAKISVFLKTDGSAEMKHTIEKHGDQASDTRDDLYNLDKKEKSLNEYYNRIFPGSKISDVKVINASRNKPVNYTYNMQVKDFASITDGELIFSPFFIQSQYYRTYAMNTNRNFPVSTAHFSTSLELIINLPEGYVPVNLPKNKKLKHQYFEANYTYKYTEKAIYINFEFKIKTYSILPEDYAAFRAMTRSIQEEESRKIILQKK